MSNLTFFDEEFLANLDVDCSYLELAEKYGYRNEAAQLLIDKYTVLRNVMDEYRNRVISAEGIKTEWKNRLLELRNSAYD